MYRTLRLRVVQYSIVYTLPYGAASYTTIVPHHNVPYSRASGIVLDPALK